MSGGIDFAYIIGFSAVPLAVGWIVVLLAYRKMGFGRACLLAALLTFAICAAGSAPVLTTERSLAGMLCGVVFLAAFIIQRLKERAGR